MRESAGRVDCTTKRCESIAACLCVSVVLVLGALRSYLPVLIMVGTSTNKDMAKRQPADAGDSTYCPGRDVNRRGKR